MSPRAPRSTPTVTLPEGAVLPDAFIDLTQCAAPLRWDEIFGAARPVELEIGCGNGRFLALAAPEQPGTSFFGIEIAAKYALLAARRMTKKDLANVRIAAADANPFLEKYIAPGSLAAAHIYFSDPWPKRRHAKRRVFQYAFLTRLARGVRAGGIVHVKTDVDWYFADIVALFAEHPAYRIVRYGEQMEFPEEELHMTGFESKALRQGRRVFYLDCRVSGSIDVMDSMDKIG